VTWVTAAQIQRYGCTHPANAGTIKPMDKIKGFTIQQLDKVLALYPQLLTLYDLIRDFKAIFPLTTPRIWSNGLPQPQLLVHLIFPALLMVLFVT